MHERIFYAVMRTAHSRGDRYPLPWWVQQYFRAWPDHFDGGMFDSVEAAFAGNADYRYWSMVGVKDHTQESLIGQAGEVEPVYDRYSLGFFLFNPADRGLHFPQDFGTKQSSAPVRQRLEDGYLPVVVTTYGPVLGVEVTSTAFATTTGLGQRAMMPLRLMVTTASGPPGPPLWLCVFVQAVGPSGLSRRYRGQAESADHRLGSLTYDPADMQVLTNASLGPAFDRPPTSFGVYGNPDASPDPDRYLADNPFADLARYGMLNGQAHATDGVAGLCTAAFAWPVVPDAAGEFSVVVRMPLDDFRGDLSALRAEPFDALADANRAFWKDKVDRSGLQLSLPNSVAHLWDLFRTCRATLLILTDHGQIHPGPTIYDSFWIRDSSVESIAAALVGDSNVAARQVGDLYRAVFQTQDRPIGPASSRGFFGGEHEIEHHEWDANGQVLWAIGRLDRILGPAAGLGAGMFQPFVVEGARWLQHNRDQYGLLHSGWSAEHLGSAEHPHYWDDLWAISGLYEAARLAERLGASEVGQLWSTYDEVREATRASVQWVLDEQRAIGEWETYVPTGPSDVGQLNSEIIGACAYFHPCRLYQDAKLGARLDDAFRSTLDTIWYHFVANAQFPNSRGFQHDRAWNAYGPYLTLQLAHAFLLVGDVAKMDACLAWVVGAGYPKLSRDLGTGGDWQVALAAWNEQHAYPVAEDFAYVPRGHWYMGDIPHGWAAAELMLLLRDILLFESDEDGHPHIYLAAGVMPHWLGDGEVVRVDGAPTAFGSALSYSLRHEVAAKRLYLEVNTAPEGISFVMPCRVGDVIEVVANGVVLALNGRDVALPAGTTHAKVSYR